MCRNFTDLHITSFLRLHCITKQHPRLDHQRLQNLLPWQHHLVADAELSAFGDEVVLPGRAMRDIASKSIRSGVSQMRTVPSFPPEMICCPSGLKATA